MGHSEGSNQYLVYAQGNHACMDGDRRTIPDYVFGTEGRLNVNNLVLKTDIVNPPLHLTANEKAELLDAHLVACKFLSGKHHPYTRSIIINRLRGTPASVMAGLHLGVHVDLGVARFPTALKNVVDGVLDTLCPRVPVPEGAQKLNLGELPATGACACAERAPANGCVLSNSIVCHMRHCSVHLGALQRVPAGKPRTAGTQWRWRWWWWC